MRKHTAAVATLLFGSGFCALVYQIGWVRELRLIFGASTAASAAVLAIFVGGLGAGGLLLGRHADVHARPLLLYARLEAIVALSAAASPWLLSLVRTLYVGAGGTPRLGLIVGTLARLALTALVLGTATIAMGGTLPAAARSVMPDNDSGRRQVATLYALNTLGAVSGCLAATFFMLEHFGTRETLWLAATVNGLIAIAAWQIDRGLATSRLQGDTTYVPDATDDTQRVRATLIRRRKADKDDATHARDRERGDARGRKARVQRTPTDAVPENPAATPSFPANHDRPTPVWFVLVASGIAGFVFFLMELVWYRMLGPLLGGLVFTFGLILAVALAGIGMGGLWYASAMRERAATLRVFTWTCLLEAAAIALPFALGDRIALLALVLRPLARIGFGVQVGSWTIVTVLVVLPAAVAAGFQFPLLIALFGRGRERIGQQIGAAYASNTVGAIAGSLAGGFGLLPWLSAPGAWRCGALALVALGIVTLALSWQRGARHAIAAPLAVALAVPLCFLATGPTAVWRHSGIGAGRAQATISSWNQLREWSRAIQRAIVWDEDGTESSVALSVEPAGYSFIVNGKGDGSARTDAGTQVMLGLLGAILNPEARRSLVIGLGTGSSAGWLGVVPTMDRVDVVELEPLIVDIARACDEVNRDVLRNPKVRITIGDAREFLLTARDHYDLIASEPSNPFRAGVASLFTQEYYQAASQRLTDGGLFLQWVQLYEIDAPTLKTVYATLASVFPYVEAWQTGGTDLVLVGAKRSLVHRADALARRIQEEPFKSALNVVWRAVDLHGLLAHFVANERLTPLILRAPGVTINTDNRNVVESGFARSVGTEESLLVDLRMLARSAGRERPILGDAASIDWDAVETAWVGYQAAEGHLAGVEAGGVAQEHARQTALIRYYRDIDLIGARAAWREQSQPPAGPTETAMLAEIEAEAASDTALDYILALRSYEPGEADTILATLRFRQARFDDAAAAIEEALENFRTDPWALTRFKQRAVGLAGAVAIRSPQIAARMFEALRAPLSLRALHDERLGVLAALTRRVGFEASCQDVVGVLEPQAPWTLTFLTIRRDCYQATGDPRLALAARELRQFLAHEPVSLKSGF